MATIWTTSLLLEHLGEAEAARAVFDALCAVVRRGEVRTPDLGGGSRTAEVGDAVAAALREGAA